MYANQNAFNIFKILFLNKAPWCALKVKTHDSEIVATLA